MTDYSGVPCSECRHYEVVENGGLHGNELCRHPKNITAVNRVGGDMLFEGLWARSKGSDLAPSGCSWEGYWFEPKEKEDGR